MNFNGLSPLESEEFNFNSCLVPSSFDPPFKIGSTTSTITIGWTKPIDNGGCPLIEFAVYRDDGLGGDLITEVNLVNDLAVRKMPTLRKLIVTNFPANSGSTERDRLIQILQLIYWQAYQWLQVSHLNLFVPVQILPMSQLLYPLSLMPTMATML